MAISAALAAGLAAGGVSAGGGIVSSVLNYVSQKKTNELNAQLYREGLAFNSAEAQKQRDWEERMSNTAYQRGVEDMRAAGINPMLGYAAGQADSPAGSSANSAGTISLSAPQLRDFISSAFRDATNAALTYMTYHDYSAHNNTHFGFGR